MRSQNLQPSSQPAETGEASAWDVYIEESTVAPFPAERVLQHARRLVEEAEETSSTEKAELAIYVLNTPGVSKNEELEQEITALQARAQVVLKGRSSQPSRRD